MRLVFSLLLAPFACGACADAFDEAAWRGALDEVVATERAFAGLASDSTVQHAFLTWIDSTATIFRPGPVMAGAALREQPFPPDMLLTWEPEWADASRDGNTGFTTGPWRAGRRGAATAATAHGRYVTIWQRTPAGDFRARLDFGTANPEIPPAPLEPRPPPEPDSSGEEALASVRDADARFNELLATAPGDIADAYAPDARILRDGMPPRSGRDAAIAAWAGAAPIDWSLAGFDAAASNDLAWTWGTWTAPPDAAGAPPTGAWLRIWRRSPAGRWSLLLDALAGPL